MGQNKGTSQRVHDASMRIIRELKLRVYENVDYAELNEYVRFRHLRFCLYVATQEIMRADFYPCVEN